MGQADLTQWAQPNYVDDDFTIASPIGIPVFSSPIEASTNEYVFTQEFMQFRSEFVPLDLNTPHDSEGQVPDYSDYFLVAEGPRQTVGTVNGGVVKWTRTYAIAPDSWENYESYGYQFIGFSGVFLAGTFGTVNPIAVTGRPRQEHVVDTRIQYDYFKTGPGAAYASPGQIPQIRAQQYLTGGTVALPTEYIFDALGPFPATTPSRTTYNGWMTNAKNLGFASGVVGATGALGANPGQIAAEDSRLSRWKGNIFMRQTRYVLAQ